MTAPTIVDLFAGPGGWSAGLNLLGLAETVGVEWDTAACDTARAAGHPRLQADIADLDPRTVAGPGHLDGLIASPPCQGFSMAGKGKGRGDTPLILDAVTAIRYGGDVQAELDWLRLIADDARSALVLEPLRWALALRPTWTAWEQVPAVLPLWEACADVLRAHGWQVWVGNVQAEQYGVPQTRKRAILLAHRDREVGPPPPTAGDVVGIGEVLEPAWPDAVIVAAGWNGEGRPRRLTEPAGTITGKGTAYWLPSPSAWRAAIRGRVQRLTPAEAGVLQSFPADHPWSGSSVDRYRQVGDAVPPLLAAHCLAALGVGDAAHLAHRAMSVRDFSDYNDRTFVGKVVDWFESHEAVTS